MKKYIIIFLSLILIIGCEVRPKAEDIFKEKHFNFKVEKKYIEDKYHILSGHNNASYETFEEIGFIDFYKIVEIGDSVIKPKKSLDIKIIRKDSLIKIYTANYNY